MALRVNYFRLPNDNWYSFGEYRLANTCTLNVLCESYRSNNHIIVSWFTQDIKDLEIYVGVTELDPGLQVHYFALFKITELSNIFR